ncbi:hypothetical protein PFISCL1PPCAC_11955, partial [Pristionchus fissidentatus]
KKTHFQPVHKFDEKNDEDILTMIQDGEIGNNPNDSSTELSKPTTFREEERKGNDDSTPIRVTIYDSAVSTKKVLIAPPSETRVCDLSHHEDLVEYIEDRLCEWSCDGDVLKSITIATLSTIATMRPLELVCTLKK